MRVKHMETGTSALPGRYAHTALAGLVAVLSWLVASSAFATTMESIEFSSLPGDKTEIRMKFDGTPPDPKSYTIESPARIALDLMDTKSALTSKYHSLGIGNAREVTVIEAKDRTRVIVNLTQLVPYETKTEGDTLFMYVGTGSASASVPSPQKYGDADVVKTEVAPSRDSHVTDVDFRRGENGEGRVVVTLSDPKAPVDVTSEAGQIKIQIRNTQLPDTLRRRLDVTDFATPVQIVDAVQSGPNITISIAAKGNFDYLAYQADQTLTVNVNPISDKELASRDDVFKYKGEKLSLNFQDIEVRSVLQLIADFTDLNLVASDTVSGRITLRLKNVPWDQALELILKTKGLDKRQVGNVLLVAPAAEIAAREKLELENQRQIAELAPLRTEFIQIRYANASELYKLFNSSTSSGGKAAGSGGAGAGAGATGGRSSIVSARGSVIVDERTNSIILTDTADRLEEFRKVIARLDIPVRQVLIESRIVTASTNYDQELGIRWGGATIANTNGTTVKTGGSLNTLNELQNIIVGGGVGSVTSPDDLVVDLGVAAASSSFGVGFTGSNYLVDLELTALEVDGRAQVVARPKVITADKQTATIQSGTEIPYQEASSSGATSVSFKEAVLSLEVTPQITPDDRIIMTLKVNQDSVGQVFNGVPSIDTNQVKTQVLVDNAQTVVLGGIFKDQVQTATEKTPFLGDLPYVGRLFRKTLDKSEKQELLIFITPRIIQESLTTR
jgi:type IV pilus assembly protein PilQ